MAKFIKRNQTEVDFDLQKIDQAVGRAAEDIGCKLNTGEFHTKLLDILAVGENTVVTYRQLLDGIRETLQALQLTPVWQAYDHYAHRRDQVRDQLMIADENKGTGDVTDRGLLLVSSGSNMDMHKWDRKRIVLKLQQLMPEVPKAEAEIVAKQVENKLVLGDYSYVNTSLITAMVNVELTKRGYTPMPEMSTYTVDAEFIENLCCTKNLENSNVVSNTPETVSENLAEYILKSYALDHVFSKEVANAHVTGRIQLHDLGLPTRVYALDGKLTKVWVRYGDLEKQLSLKEIWDRLDVPVKRLNETQLVKVLPDQSLLVQYGDRFVPVEQLVLTVEEIKPGKHLELVDGSAVSATDEHGIPVRRGNKLLLVRADEVLPTDELIKVKYELSDVGPETENKE